MSLPLKQQRHTGWRYTVCASSEVWWQDMRNGRWILMRGTKMGGRRFHLLKDLERDMVAMNEAMNNLKAGRIPADARHPEKPV